MEDHRRRITTVRQLELLVEYLEGHQSLALGRVRSKEARALADRMWRECAEILNGEGPARTGKEWTKVWNDLKARVRGKLVAINANQNATGGGPSTAPALTPIEERVGNLLGRDVGPLPNVRQELFDVEEDLTVENREIDQIVEINSPAVPPIILYEVLPTPPRQTTPPAVSPAPSERGHHPTPPPSGRTRIRGRQSTRASRLSIAARPPAQSNRNALEESRQMVLKIEEMRAEANLVHARALASFSQSLEVIAQSVAAVCRNYISKND